MNTSAERIAFCPHCGNRAPQRLRLTQDYMERAWYTDTGDEAPIPSTYYVAECATCGELLLYQEGHPSSQSGFWDAGLIWPSYGLSDSAPASVREIYSEASRIKAVAPNAFAVQIRRALEAVCKDRGATKGTLAKQLEELSARGEIPATLAQASDVLRLVGNIGAHASDESVYPLQATAIDNFFRAIVEYVYVSPRRIAEFKESMGKYKKASGDADA